MMEALDFYQTPVLYFDTDLLFKQSPTQLLSKVSPTNILMNADEGKISDYPEWDFLSDYIENSLEPNELGLSRNSPMYNSGIVGLCPEHRQAIERSIQLTRVLYKQEPVFNIEQFSTGVLLAEKSQVHFCIDDVYHYWGWRRKFVHLELQRFRAKYEGCSGAALIKAYRSDPPGMIPSIHLNDRIENKIKSLLTGWDADYQFAYLCYLSALRIGDEDSQLANAWIKTCLDAIAKFVGNGESKSHAFNVEKDFGLIMPDSGRQLSWLDQTLQAQFLQLSE